MRHAAALLVFLCACKLHSGPPEPPPMERPDASFIGDADTDESGCARIGCGDGRHCEIQCSQYGPVGCIYNCHATCMPDAECAAVDTCMPPSLCVESCSNECQGMADLCQLSCADPDGSCEQITDEADCKARSDCMPMYLASGCTCPDIDTCTCTDEMVSFARCVTTTVPD